MSLPLLALPHSPHSPNSSPVANVGEQMLIVRDGDLYIVSTMNSIRWTLEYVRGVSYHEFPYAFLVSYGDREYVKVEYERKVDEKSPENGWTITDLQDPSAEPVHFPGGSFNGNDKGDNLLTLAAEEHVKAVLQKHGIGYAMYDQTEVVVLGQNKYIELYEAHKAQKAHGLSGDAHSSDTGRSSAIAPVLTGTDFDRTVEEFKTRKRPYMVMAYKSGNVARATLFTVVPTVTLSPVRGRLVRTFYFKVGASAVYFDAGIDLSSYRDFWRTGTEEDQIAAMRSTIGIRGEIAAAGKAELNTYNIARVAIDASTARTIALQYDSLVPMVEALVLNGGHGWVVKEAQRRFPIIATMLAFGMVDAALRVCGHTIYRYAPYPSLDGGADGAALWAPVLGAVNAVRDVNDASRE